MAFIPCVDENEASGELKEIYDAIRGGRGGVGNILKIQSLNPPTLGAHFDLYKTLMFGQSKLDRVRREMIAVAVSSLNNCHY